jgi:hypothetical protein
MQGVQEMKQTKTFSRRSKVGFSIAAAFLLACGVAYMTLLKIPKEETLPEVGIKQTIHEFPESVFLKARPAADSVRDHLLDGDFKVVNHVQAIPQTWRSIFDSSFVDIHGLPTKGARVEMADPGQPFQSSDALVPGLPFRRLVLAGLSSQKCFIYYQHGGSMYPSYCLAVMDYGSNSMIWVGESRKVARSLSDLRFMLSRGLFEDTGGPGC